MYNNEQKIAMPKNCQIMNILDHKYQV